ncbi:MAG: glycosyltransferase [Candidatus Omnitrophota bacterium]
MEKPSNSTDIPLISVIIGTYNRCRIITDTLQSLSSQEGNIATEIIIVDNNSRDETKKVIMSFEKKFKGRLKYVFEKRQGLSFARNTGVNQSRGEIIAFTDDDVILSPQWLLHIKNGFINHKCCALGGKILPVWEKTPPYWLTKELWYQLALLDLGDECRWMKESNTGLFGANLAVKKRIFEEGFNFDTSLGVCGKKKLLGEDIQLFFWLLDNNKKIIYDPKILVWHKISKERLTPQYFMKWRFYAGQSFIYLKQFHKNVINQKQTTYSRNKSKKYFYTVVKTLVVLKNYILSILFFDSGRRFKQELRLMTLFGKCYAYLTIKFRKSLK